MKSAQVCIKSIDFKEDHSYMENSLWGEIFIKIGDYSFPDDLWYDAVSSLLDMWTAEIIDLMCYRKTEGCLHFMDGPFFVELSFFSRECILATCKERDGEEHAKHIVNLYELAKSILDNSCSFLNSCRSNAPYFINTRTGQNIVQSSNKLKKIMSNIKK